MALNGRATELFCRGVRGAHSGQQIDTQKAAALPARGISYTGKKLQANLRAVESERHSGWQSDRNG
jgi:hypothetical protein